MANLTDKNQIFKAIADRVVTIHSIVCSKCFKVEESPESSETNAAVKFQEMGWSADKNHELLCPECIKKPE